MISELIEIQKQVSSLRHIVLERVNKIQFDLENLKSKNPKEIKSLFSKKIDFNEGVPDSTFGFDVEDVKKFILDDWNLFVEYVEGNLNLGDLIKERNKLIGEKMSRW